MHLMGLYIVLLGFLAVFIGVLLLLVLAFTVAFRKGPGDKKARRSDWRKACCVLCSLIIGFALIFLGAAMIPGVDFDDFTQAVASLKYPKGNYDLTGTIDSYTPDPVRVGDAVTFEYTVKNIGTDEVPPLSYMVVLYVDKKRVSYDGATSALLPGAGVTYGISEDSCHFRARRTGTYRYRLEIIPRLGLVDANLHNNQVVGALFVKEKPSQ